MARPSDDEGCLKSKPVRHVATRQRLIRVVMYGDRKNPISRYDYCGYRTSPIDVQQVYEGEKDG